jgi:3-keto-L-gulonate-6-phosphate decarboxylase
MDAGEREARSVSEAGADYVTVLGVTDFAVVEGRLKTAGKYRKTVCVTASWTRPRPSYEWCPRLHRGATLDANRKRFDLPGR